MYSTKVLNLQNYSKRHKLAQTNIYSINIKINYNTSFRTFTFKI